MRYVIGKVCEPFSTKELSLPHNADDTVSTGDSSNLFMGEISRRGEDRGHCRMPDDDGMPLARIDKMQQLFSAQIFERADQPEAVPYVARRVALRNPLPMKVSC